MRFILALGLVSWPLLAGVICRPLEPNTKYQIFNRALEFMKKYGYVQADTNSTAALYTDESIAVVIKEVQKFGAIPQTGIFDDATIELMSKRRCGLPDKLPNRRRRRFVLSSKSWQKSNVTYFVANAPYSLGVEGVAADVRRSLEEWGRYSNLKFQRAFTIDADIVIFFASGEHGDSLAFDGEGGVLAHAYFPGEYDHFAGDVHFDADENWRKNSGDEGTYFLSVAIHELGHSLGLAHSPETNSVMFPYYRTDSVHLGYDDVLALYEKYIKHPPVRSTEDKVDNDGDDNNSGYDKSTEENEKNNDIDNNIPNDATPYPTSTTTKENESWTSTESYVTYEGDNESVETHKQHDRTHGIPPNLPDICEGNYDAVATFRNEVFVFKGKFLWRLTEGLDLLPGYPIPITQMFPLPKSIQRIDAAYERPDGFIIIFSGKHFWVFNGGTLLQGSPVPLTYYGLPSDLDKIDAIQTWAKNGKTYIYRADRFWRYNETSKTMDDGYPKHMDQWNGVPHDLDAAMTWKGVTYFFKGNLNWKFDNNWLTTSDKSPLPAAGVWLGCLKEDD